MPGNPPTHTHTYKDLENVYELFDAAPDNKKDRRTPQIEFREIDSPPRLDSINTPIGNLDATAKPARDMINIICDRLARAGANPRQFRTIL